MTYPKVTFRSYTHWLGYVNAGFGVIRFPRGLTALVVEFGPVLVYWRVARGQQE